MSDKIIKESLQKEMGRVIHNPIDGPDIVIDVPRPQPKNPEPCGNGIKPKQPPKPSRKTPLDPRLGRDEPKR